MTIVSTPPHGLVPALSVAAIMREPRTADDDLPESIERLIAYANNWERMGTVLPLVMLSRRRDWRLMFFRALGRAWTVADDHALYYEELRLLLRFASRAELNQLMNEGERRELEQLPESLTVYRGCALRHRGGLSWSLDREVAVQFAERAKRRRPDDVTIVMYGQIRRSRVSALKTERDESEIISPFVDELASEVVP